MKATLLLAATCLSGLLAPAALAAATNSDVYVVPFSHLDLFWAGTREECLSRGNRIISKAIQIAEKQPEFRFLIEDEVFVANYVDSHHGSTELDTLKRLVKEGRIELAPKWAAIYQNLPRGEAHARNQLYGKFYAREVFQVNPRVAHLGDLPGYTQQFPQILSKSDTPFMAMTRMGPPEHPLFRWRSPDGSTALVWNAVNGYGWGVGLGLHRDDLDDTRITKVGQSVGQVQSKTSGPIFLGWGTDLYAPSQNIVPNVALLNQRLAAMHFQVATPNLYFQAAAKVNDLPELTGEIPSSWANIITSLSQLWPPTISATDMLLSAEKFAAINYALGYAAYPQQEFDALWKQVLQTMDHNNFGQGADPGDARKLEYALNVEQRAGQILRDSLRNIAERVQRPMPRCTPIVVFNPLNWIRDDTVQAHVSLYGDVAPGEIADYRKAMRLVDETGADVPFHVEKSYGTVSCGLELVFVAHGVPSMGYKTWFVVPAEKVESGANTCDLKLDDADPAKPKRVLGSDQFENQYYRVTVDRATGRITLLDKELDRVVVKDMEIAALEQRGGDTLSNERPSGRTLINSVNRVEVAENNSTRTVIRIEGELAGTPVTQRMFLYSGLKRVDMENTVDWHQDRFMKIEQLFTYDIPDARIRYGIPFGSAAGSDIMPGAGPRFSDEVPKEIWKTWRQIQDWVFAGNSDYGVTIAADRQLISLRDSVIAVGMLRGCYSTLGITQNDKATLRKIPPAGKYVFRYALTSGRGNWVAAKSYRCGMAFSNPLIAVSSVDELAEKTLSPTYSFCSVKAGNLVLTALKKAEQKDAMVLRCVEMEGAPALLEAELLGRKAGFSEVNLLEEDKTGESSVLNVKPYELMTLRLPAP
jgi:alpha-mannosidase